MSTMATTVNGELVWAIFIVVLLSPLCTICESAHDPRELVNACIASDNRKSKPGPEAVLYKECEPWANNSCCTSDTAVAIHHTNFYNATHDHCEVEMGRKMSSECRRQFNRDMCFLECDPHIAPWKIETMEKLGNERFSRVPFCASDCERWFNACRSDFTCVGNWIKDLNVTTGGNRCPKNSTCRPFVEVYGTARRFCEMVWDFALEYTDDSEGCIRTWFNSSVGNPNEKVAEVKIRQLIENSQTRSSGYSITMNSVVVTCFIAIFLLKCVRFYD